MEDLPIGSEIVLKVVETKEADCTGCFFDEIANIINIETCNRIKCASNERIDGKNVQFKRVK
nr:MAG TPA: hypothetical protein [Caudoviricetes sp.]